MQISYYINEAFEDVFIPRIETDAAAFSRLGEHARKWVAVITREQATLDKYPDAVLNLSYNVAGSFVTPRNFSPFELIIQLNKAVNLFDTGEHYPIHNWCETEHTID